MKTVDLKTVLDWNPCVDFPRERIEKLFAGRETVSVADGFAVDMRQDEQLWFALREAFFTPLELETMAAYFAIHASRGIDYSEPSASRALLNATMASTGNFDLLPEDKRQDRWKKGATDPEKCAALSALWSARARAETQTKKEKRLHEWNKERDWQVKHVKQKAGI
jgi:hypothetical protein